MYCDDQLCPFAFKGTPVPRVHHPGTVGQQCLLTYDLRRARADHRKAEPEPIRTSPIAANSNASLPVNAKLDGVSAD